jgi:predicted RNA-binding protein YlxR (DUF448 family)
VEAVTMRKDDQSPNGTSGAKGEKPSRTCVGCHARIDTDAPANANLGDAFRVVLGLVTEAQKHEVAVDLAGSSFGRGAHVHATAGCLAKACAGGFSKAFRRQVSAEPAKLVAEVARVAHQRIEGLLLGARRAGHLAFGEEAKGHSAEDTPLFLVARDAGGSALGGPLRHAVAEGRVLVWGTKESLGNLFSRELVALVAVRHESVAREIRKTSRLPESLGVIVAG